MSQFSAEIQCTFLKRKDMQRKFQSDFSRVPVRSQKKIVKNIFYVFFFCISKSSLLDLSRQMKCILRLFGQGQGGGGAAGP